MSAVAIPSGVRLLLVRHGSTAWSEAGRLCGWADVPLSARGRAEAGALRRRIGEIRGLCATWSSDLLRARETARLAGLAASPDARLRELDFGSVEGSRWEELSDPIRAGLLGFDGFRAPGGESVAGLAARVGGFLSGLPPGSHVLVTHGGVIRLLLSDRRAVAPGEMVWAGAQPAACS